MKTEKDKSIKPHGLRMGNVTHKYDARENEPLPAGGYHGIVEGTAVGNPSFTAYASALSHNVESYFRAKSDKKRKAVPGMRGKADAFLRDNLGIGFDDFIQRRHARSSEDEPLVRGSGEGNEVYELEVMVYLGTMKEVEDKGFDVRDVIRGMRKSGSPLRKRANLGYVLETLQSDFEGYLLGLLEISERSARGEGSASELLNTLNQLRRKNPIPAIMYKDQSADLEGRLVMESEEGRYDSLMGKE